MDNSLSLWLDKYDEIFSDFDSRDYTHRSISEDFLTELKNIYSDQTGNVTEFKLLMPRQKRDLRLENIICIRLKNYFNQHFNKIDNLKRKIKRKGILYILGGILLLVIINYILLMNAGIFSVKIMSVISEPGGWFLIWIGLENLFITPKTKTPEYNFYKKFSGVTINFSEY